MAISKQVLVVDDEPIMRDMLYSALRRKKMPVDRAENGKQALSMLEKKPYDIIISDMRMPHLSGIDLLQSVKKKYPDIDVIMLTAYGTIDDAVLAMKSGAFDFIEKKESTLLDEVELKIDRLLEHRKLKQKNKNLEIELDIIKSEIKIEKEFIGKDKSMQELFATIKLAANSSATVFIQGESGTGKELVARALHEQSPRKNKPFIKVNCAAMPDGLIESELFGHEKGAFTGAVKTTKGKFELANGGTILLDEISEMNPLLQAKLLRILQEKEFEKIGDNKTIKLDVRIIATTNRDIQDAINEGLFREDLYYRLNVVPIYLPALRERKSDISILANYFMIKYKDVHNRGIDGFSPEAMQIIINYDWPGNVRQLENSIERAVVLSKGNIIIPSVLSLNHSSSSEKEQVNFNNKINPNNISTLAELEQGAILKTLEIFEGNRTKTAESLNISIRTLRNKLNEYRANGINID